MARPKRKPQKNRNPTAAFLVLGVATIILAILVIYQLFLINGLTNKINLQSILIATLSNKTSTNTTGSNLAPLPTYNIQSEPVVPPLSLSAYPVITENQTFGKRLTGINSQLNQSELAVINNAPNSYFEIAGEMLLNGTVHNVIVTSSWQKVNNFTVNGKPSVIYYGSVTCIFCGENRWAMALALGKFGNFGHLFKGYSSLGDGDVPTLYWRPIEYSNTTMNIGSFYNSSYINFLSLEDSNPITGGFNLQTFQQVGSELNTTGNLAYIDAFSYINKIGTFSGTPYTIWGRYVVSGADAVDFGNTTPSAPPLPLTNMTHEQVLAQLANPNDQFAWTEYAGADVYIALTCASINNTAQVCSLPAIQKLESRMGVGS